MLWRVEDIVASGNDEMAGSMDGEQNGDMDGTTSSDNTDSQRVEAAWLAVKSQQTRNNAT